MANFDYFVVLAEMRTGSNFLETNLNAIPGLACHGEAFNPAFIGFPDRDDLLGVTKAARDANPAQVIDRVREEPDILAGFRYFSDHDPRVLDLILDDPRCAKIVLTRNPIDSYVSHAIATATGQWKLTSARHAKSDRVQFDAEGFEAHLERLQSFQVRVLNALQKTGQTAFYLDYDDLQDVAVMNGVAIFLGIEGRLESLDRTLKKQNPEPLDTKVTNFPEMEAALARLDRFNLNRTPNFEPRRGAALPSYIAAPRSPLIYLPLRSGPETVVRDWLSALDGGEEVLSNFTHKTWRQWKLRHPGHRSFTVLRHPVARAHAAFCDRILATGEGSFPEIRNHLRQHFDLPLPETPEDAAYDDAAHRTAFLGYIAFAKANLAGQTQLRVDPAWATQFGQLQGFANATVPDMILREERLLADMAVLAWQIGRSDAPEPPAVTDPHAARLARIYDAGIEAAVRDAYMRDYVSFGFAAWRYST